MSYDAQGRISNFNVAQTIIFKENGVALNGLAPNPSETLGKSVDPEGIVINPINGNLLVSDGYGPTVAEFDRQGNLIRRFTVPANLIPKVGANVNYIATPSPNAAATLTAGREPNRGLEGVAISPDGKYANAVLQDGLMTDGYVCGPADANPNGWTAQRELYTRVIEYDMATGQSLGQYAYRLASTGQGRGISSLVVLGNDKFLVLEHSNRGIGVGATLSGADKNVSRSTCPVRRTSRTSACRRRATRWDSPP